MIPDAEGKPESCQTDPEQLVRLLDIELAMKRAAWAEATSRHRKIRTISFLFLALVLMGAMLGFFLIFTSLTQDRVKTGARPVASPRP